MFQRLLRSTFVVSLWLLGTACPEPVPGTSQTGDAPIDEELDGTPTAIFFGGCFSNSDCPLADGGQSGLRCVDNQCVCDPYGDLAEGCGQIGGELTGMCVCALNGAQGSSGSNAGGSDSGSGGGAWCIEVWVNGTCNPDDWVDTSYWTEHCYWDAGLDDYYCYDEYVPDGYYRGGSCTEGRWDTRCY